MTQAPPSQPDPPAEIGARPLIFDITRLLLRVFSRTPNGIDRVDSALAGYFLDRADPHRSGVILTPIGPRVLAPEAAREAIAIIREHWGENEAADDCPTLRGLLASLGGLAAPVKRLSKGRRGRYAKALHWIFRHAVARGQSPRDFLADGGAYVNVSQFPLWADRYFRWLDDASGIDGVFFIHDLLPLETPEYFRPSEEPRHRRRLNTLARRGAGAIVSTEVVRQALSRHLATLGRADLPILVAPLPVDPIFSAPSGEGAPEDVPPYFVLCGTIEPRKNHLLILHAWRDLVAAHGDDAPHLILVGARGWENEHIIDLLERCPGLHRHVTEVSGLSTPALRHLLAGARALLMPSFAEGYGLPLVEALASGVPVIASDIQTFRETGGARVLMIDPTDGPKWRAAIEAFAATPSPAREETAARAASFQPPDAARHFARIEAFVASLSQAKAAAGAFRRK
ncbi:glycosyltransferase [Rhodoblastus acidophilus]|uniref:Glycosyltransferase n=1 Tax=Candidatus Rhodoblastus alkanivorans TaxID=2954117 RepID=A0ABS9Z3U2_9HYPH|nr:glycosyltransferase [Candidatus Rhodoblastus alkanivorans]MCI4677483.1 glycosyltransferase [Candidatus Rhodoblastus alkanivorans]MCI4681842.1 glycosyltransferase [Candidatus Rhodoblastus alkanivorans]MDI4642892.1 glycosyltransferase [Rhodoblastus acidophilus]